MSERFETIYLGGRLPAGSRLEAAREGETLEQFAMRMMLKEGEEAVELSPGCFAIRKADS